MKLYDHQIDVLEQTKDKNKCAYYLDMGLGKTFVGSEKMMNLKNKSNLVICQKSKIQDWIDHFNTYYNVKVYDLTKIAQLDEFIGLSMGERFTAVGVINYDLIFRRTDILNLDNFTLMLDESSLISNDKAKRTKFILKLNPKNVILLSGTPTSGKYENLWSQCKLLGWNISKSAFWKSYVITKWDNFGQLKIQRVVGYKNVEHLKKKLREYGCIFMKSEEVINLPDKIEQQIFVNKSKFYTKFKKDSYILIEDKELVGDNSLTKILYLRQLCGQYSDEKLNAFNDLIQSTEDRLIVFYNFTEEYLRLREIAENNGKHCSVINGQNRDLKNYEEYNDTITFVQYQAGAMGLNLQKSNKIIYFSLPLGKGSCNLWEQSKKRIHRIGQNRSCFYYYMLVKNSIETWNLELLKEGKELTDDLFIKKF